MSNRNNILDRDEKDIPLRATIWMWGLSTPLFFACIPIIALTSIGILLPLALLVALMIGTTSVWFFHSQSMTTAKLELKQLQERIVNLETIASHEELDGKFIALEQIALKSSVDR